MCGGPSSSLSRAYLAALRDRPRIPSPHSFSALWRTHNPWFHEHYLHTYSHTTEISFPYKEFNNVINSTHCMYIYHLYMYVCNTCTYRMREMQCFSPIYNSVVPQHILCLICNQHSTTDNASQAQTGISVPILLKIKLHSLTTSWLHQILTISGNRSCRFSFSGTVLDRLLHQVHWNKKAALRCSGPEVITCEGQQKGRSQPGFLPPVTLKCYQTPLEA